jgi:hypothetical protein
MRHRGRRHWPITARLTKQRNPVVGADDTAVQLRADQGQRIKIAMKGRQPRRDIKVIQRLGQWRALHQTQTGATCGTQRKINWAGHIGIRSGIVGRL